MAKVMLILGYGVLIELLQSLTDYRSASLADLVADSLGIASYLLITPLLKQLPLCRLRWKQAGIQDTEV